MEERARMDGVEWVLLLLKCCAPLKGGAWFGMGIMIEGRISCRGGEAFATFCCLPLLKNI
jgi:hypothetical protein